ncbi:hypothetical protein SKAU_G00160150 [Synaphobranchus kaupii]|uniref:Uncharacterized protein n=1 Tax=Synaphobranchus kaupii TaxID=118154 RepID=A0A9Q1IZP6_SYNKA|nr:hypothetical protein SKAU_G00160150 [Synaphobranchus kaupii]
MQSSLRLPPIKPAALVRSARALPSFQLFPRARLDSLPASQDPRIDSQQSLPPAPAPAAPISARTQVRPLRPLTPQRTGFFLATPSRALLERIGRPASGAAVPPKPETHGPGRPEDVSRGNKLALREEALGGEEREKTPQRGREREVREGELSMLLRPEDVIIFVINLLESLRGGGARFLRRITFLRNAKQPMRAPDK